MKDKNLNNQVEEIIKICEKNGIYLDPNKKTDKFILTLDDKEFEIDKNFNMFKDDNINPCYINSVNNNSVNRTYEFNQTESNIINYELKKELKYNECEKVDIKYNVNNIDYINKVQIISTHAA